MRTLKQIHLNGWNMYTNRFIDPPLWTWDVVPGVTTYRVMLATGEEPAQTYDVKNPRFDMSTLWDQLDYGPIDMLVVGIDSRDEEACISLYKNFYKLHDFDGHKQTPLDWQSALRRNAEFLLAPARDRVEPYEENLPRACWMSMEDSASGQRWSHNALPGLYHTSHIFAFLRFSERFPEDPMAVEAKRQAKIFGDWLLHSRLPEDWVYGMFPFSIVTNGILEEGHRGTTVTRAGRVGIAMLELYRTFNNKDYLEYARILANGLVKFQSENGSWPFRVNPKDGSVLEEYTSDAISPARLFALLEEIEPNATYRKARLNAIKWTLEVPVKMNRWEGMYEDTSHDPPYANMENLDTNETVRYLVHYRHENQDYLEMAKRLNRWIEDQFVVFETEDCKALGSAEIGTNAMGAKNLRSPTPMVVEQYMCDYPMEGHTGNWLMSLIALHQATGNNTYLDKGVAAANAIVQGQQESGAFSTWGFDLRFGRPLSQLNWPGDNACGHTGLLLWDQYYKVLQKGEHFELGLWGL